MKLFSKTWINDIPWIELAIHSVSKMCTEHIEWHIVIEDEDIGKLDRIASHLDSNIEFKIHKLSEKWPEAMELKNGYLRQQWVKMTAHRVMGTDVFWNYDSDVIAIRKFSSKDLIGGSGRPIYWITQMNAVVDPVNQQVYVERANVLKQIFGLRNISFEWMRCMPIAMNGEILRCGSEQPEWKMFFDLCKQDHPYLSEFNTIGQFAHLNFPDAFEWRNTYNYPHTWMSHPGNGANQPGGWNKAVEMTSAIFFQGWSWGGIPDEMRKGVYAL